VRFLAILTVRNEGAFLLEWLAHHRAVGFTDFLVFSNDCDDGTDLMLDRLQDLGLLTHVRNDGVHNRGIQWSALKAADQHPLVASADWIAVLDIDEFVNIHVGQRHLSDLLDALPDATAITLTWRLFGNAGVVTMPDQPVTETFVRAAPAILYWPWRAAMFKTLFRNDGTYRKLGVHRPKSPRPGAGKNTRWFDGHGRALTGPVTRNRVFSDFGRDNYGLVQLNHYALGAMDNFILKRHRGRANRRGTPHGMSYWVDRNWSQTGDRSVLALVPERDVHLATFRGDPTLADLHRAAYEWRRQKFRDLMQDEENRALLGRLMLAGPSQPLPVEKAAHLFSFAQKQAHSPD